MDSIYSISLSGVKHSRSYTVTLYSQTCDDINQNKIKEKAYRSILSQRNKGTDAATTPYISEITPTARCTPCTLVPGLSIIILWRTWVRAGRY